MTPFGKHLRKLRAERNITQKQMAQAIGVSPAYLSALENGKRGKPAWPLVQRIVGYLNVIWDEAEKLQFLARMSDPRVTIDTGNLSAKATAVANLLSVHISELDENALEKLEEIIEAGAAGNS